MLLEGLELIGERRVSVAADFIDVFGEEREEGGREAGAIFFSEGEQVVLLEHLLEGFEDAEKFLDGERLREAEADGEAAVHLGFVAARGGCGFGLLRGEGG